MRDAVAARGDARWCSIWRRRGSAILGSAATRWSKATGPQRFIADGTEHSEFQPSVTTVTTALGISADRTACVGTGPDQRGESGFELKNITQNGITYRTRAHFVDCPYAGVFVPGTYGQDW